MTQDKIAQLRPTPAQNRVPQMRCMALRSAAHLLSMVGQYAHIVGIDQDDYDSFVAGADTLSEAQVEGAIAYLRERHMSDLMLAVAGMGIEFQMPGIEDLARAPSNAEAAERMVAQTRREGRLTGDD